MKTEIKNVWVAALRSGIYQQTEGQLRNREGTGFCCLGVLCDLYSKATGKQWTKESDNVYAESAYKFDGFAGMPSSNVYEWAGLEASPVATINGDERPLDSHNDRGRTFAEIADAIEEQL